MPEIVIDSTPTTIVLDDGAAIVVGGRTTVAVDGTVEVAPPTALDDLTDVNAPTPTDAQVLTWDDGAGEWVAVDPTGGGGGDGAAVIITPTYVTGDSIPLTDAFWALAAAGSVVWLSDGDNAANFGPWVTDGSTTLARPDWFSDPLTVGVFVNFTYEFSWPGLTQTAATLGSYAYRIGDDVVALGFADDGRGVRVRLARVTGDGATTGQVPVWDGSAWVPDDVSGGGGGTVDVVSNVATARILGRTTAGSGDSEELTASDVRTLLNVADGATAGIPATLLDAKGDLIVASAADTAARLAVGANGYALTGDTTATNGVAWCPPGGFAVPIGSDRWLQPVTVLGSSTGTTTGSMAQLAHWWPCYVQRKAEISAVGTYCWTLEAGSTQRIGVYEWGDTSGSSFVPGARIADFGTLSGAATGAKSITGLTTEVCGWFWICIWCSNHATVRWEAATSGAMAGLLGIPSVAIGAVYPALGVGSVDYSAGLPSSAPALSQSSGAVRRPFAYFKLVEV